MLNEGAFSNEGLFWISPTGKTIPVNVPPYQNYSSHEEYAQEKWNVSLEEALEKNTFAYKRLKKVIFSLITNKTNLKTLKSQLLKTFFMQRMVLNYFTETSLLKELTMICVNLLETKLNQH